MSTNAIATRPFTLNYPHVFEPSAFNDEAPKYSIQMLFDKSDEDAIALLQREITTAYNEGKYKLRGSNNGPVPPLAGIKTPLRDGDAEHPGNPVYEGKLFMNATSKFPPSVFDRARKSLTDQNAIYPGAVCRAGVSFSTYNMNGNRGISCLLHSIQKIADGDPIGARQSTGAEFDDFLD